MKSRIAGLLLLAIAPLMISSSPLAKSVDVTARTRQFLDAYARGDRETVLSMIDPDNVTAYGSDLEEIFHGKAGVDKMLRDDMRLWGGKAHIGEMQHLSLVITGHMAAVFFDADFTVGERKPVPVRFSLVWRDSGNGWKLVQSSNVVPTQGQSAEKLLAAPSRD